MVRFFKLFDGNLDLLERLKSTIGQVILVIVFMMGLFLVGNPMVLLIGSALLFLALYPQKRWNIIFIFTLLHWFLGLRPGWKAVYKISKQWKLNFGYVEFYTMELFVLVTVLTFIFILLKLSQKIKFISDRPLSHIITVYLIVHIPIVFMEERTLFSFFYWACLIIFIQFYWYFAYAVYDQERNRGASWIKKISCY